MKILLIGGAGSFMNRLILKIRKEGHKTFLLTGDKYKKNKYEKVFERYDFDYDCENLKEILESINPDVTIFLGAFDTNFQWDEEERTTVYFTSALVNLLVACSAYKKGRFLFLSSGDVYQGDYQDDILENEPCSGKSMRATALAQAENVCLTFQKNNDLDIRILRLDHLYGIPEDKREAEAGICARMCIEAMRYGEITIRENQFISMIHENDAMEYIYQCVKKKEPEALIYHLSAAQVLSERELAELVQANMKESVQIKVAQQPGVRCVLSGKCFEDEYGIRALQNPEVSIRKMVAYMTKNRAVFLDGDDPKLSWWKQLKEDGAWFIQTIIPYVENLICFIPFFMMNNRVTDSAYFANLDPYLLYVLLFAIVYGQQQAVFSGACAVAGYLFRQMYHRTGFAVVLDYNTYVWIAQLFVVGLVVGYMRDQIRLMRAESKELEEHLSRQIVDIKDINGSNVRVKEALEQSIIVQEDSIGKIYKVTSKLEQYMPEEVLFYAIEILSELLGTKDIAIYNVVNGDYARLFSAGSQKARSIGKSIRYKELEEMYKAFCDHKVYINKNLDERYPLMANAIFENDELQTMIMVWGLNWEQMTLGGANFLAAISFLIQDAVIRANHYLKTLEEKRYINGTRILEPEAFSSLVEAYQNAKKKGLTECVLIQILGDIQNFQETGCEIATHLRQSDYLGRVLGQKLHILLTNTMEDEVPIVKERLKTFGYECKIVEILE